VDGFTTVAGTATNTCNGDIESIMDQLTYWSAVNPVIAQVTTGKVTGLSPGFTTANASGTVAICYGNTLHWENLNLSDPVTVQPTVTISGSTYIAMLKSGAQGSDSTTLTATGNPSGGTYSWTAVSGQGNITILNATSQSAIIQSVAVGTYTVQVTYTVNNQSGTATTVGKVQQPGSLGVISNDTQLFSCTDLGPPGSYNTQERLVQYQVLDTSSQPVPIQVLDMSATETLNVTTNTCAVPNPNPTVGAQTGSNGYFPAPDTLRLCSSVCLPANGNGNPTGSCNLAFAQTWSVNGYSVKSDTVVFTCPGPPTGAP
jgi:hypothetical protein